MARNTSAVFTAAALALIAGHGAYGQSLDAVLFGRYALSTTGQALLSDATSGACRAIGLVPAALFDTEWIFDGAGRLSAAGNEMGVSVGATSCTAVNFSVSGTYTVEKIGDNNFQAKGRFSTHPQSSGRNIVCDQTGLDVPFSIVGSLDSGGRGGATSFTITTEGGGGSYAEGTARPANLTCRANILSFTTSGSGKRTGN